MIIWLIIACRLPSVVLHLKMIRAKLNEYVKVPYSNDSKSMMQGGPLLLLVVRVCKGSNLFGHPGNHAPKHF